jgi:hypothetical protein
VDHLRGVRRARGVGAPRARGHRAHRRPHIRHRALVDRGPVGAEWLRAARPRLHRDRQDGRDRIGAARDPARPRQLVLLRARRPRSVDRPVRAVPAGHLAARRQLPRADPRVRVRGVHAVAPPRVFRRSGRHRLGHRGRPLPLRRPVVPGPPVQVVRRGVDGRARIAEHAASRSTRGARPRGAARRGRRRVSPRSSSACS